MACRILGIVQAGSRLTSHRLTAAIQPRSFMPVVFSRLFSVNTAASALQTDGVDMSSTVTEMRNFARLHGISLKGLRLKSDVFTAIQMHFGIFVTTHAGAPCQSTKLQENMMVNPEIKAVEECDVQLKVRLPHAVLTEAHMRISAMG